jgi:hypothetical protein
MISIRKNKVQALVICLMIFLTMNFLMSGQPSVTENTSTSTSEFQDPFGTTTNWGPRILFVKVIDKENRYILIKVEDEDVEKVNLQIEEYPGIKFKKRGGISISDTMKEAIFESSHVPLDLGSHKLAVIAEDPEGSITKMNVTIVVSETSIDLREEDFPPQISLTTFNIQEKIFTVTVEVIDEDPHSVDLQIESRPDLKFKEIEVASISDSMKRGTFVSDSIPLVYGLQVLTITARDSKEGEYSKQIEIEINKITEANQSPQVTFLRYENKGRNYKIETKIQDEDPGNITVSITGRPDIKFSRKAIVGKEGTFVSDPISLDSGQHPFTLSFTDLQGKSGEMQIIINVPRNVIGLLVVFLLVLLPVIAVTIFFFSRKKSKKGYLEEIDYYGKPELYKQERRALESQLSDTRSNLEQTQSHLENLEKNVRVAFSEEQISALTRIANENSQTRKDFSELLQWISQSLQNFSDLNLPYVREDLETGIRAYEKYKAVTSPQEKEAYSRAQNAYQAAMAELKRAHGALDVKILELFMKRARGLLEEPAPHGQKLLNYEASKRLSDWVQILLKDPELRVRLRKLREVGYIDPFGMT